ncbi:hypothetical protein [Blautia marasmi]|uniref:hypothetical protein n=1 Tax=Blautia marasmi TaxID=1917868 RepID=UPI0039A2F13F
MFNSKEKKQEKLDAKLQEMMNSLGVGNLSGEDREVVESILSHGCFVNNAKILSALSGGTTQAIANSLLVDLLKTNLVLIRQNDEIIKLLRNILEKSGGNI